MILSVFKIKKIFTKKNNFFGAPFLSWIVIIISSLFKLLLLSNRYLYAIGYAKHDDALFIKIANNLAKFHWLGAYDNLTLAKGPGYPIWIAINYHLGIPLIFSQYLFYIFACIVFIVALTPLFNKKKILLVIIFLVILFNPSSYSNYTTQVLREGIYPALSLLIIAFSIGIFLRKNKTINKIIFWIFGLSITLSYFWLTREEGVWIIPFLVSILLFTAFKLWIEKEKQWKLKSILLFIPFIILFLSIFAVSSINYYKYGIFTTVEFKNPEFLEAYSSLTRVKDKAWQQYIPASKSKRIQIYSVSPAFKKLEPFLEGDIGRGWALFSSSPQYKKPGEIEGGWFMWAFRDAVTAAGYYNSGKDVMNYYRQLSLEIDIACKQKKLECFGKRATMVEPFYKEQILLVFNSAVDTIKYLVNFKGSEIGQTLNSSAGDKESIDLFSKMTHEPIYINNTDETNLEVSGWAFSPPEKIVLSISNNKDELENYSVETIDSIDVYKYYAKQGEYFNNAKRAGFKILTSCSKNCFLLVTGENNLIEKIPLDGSTNSGTKPNKFYFNFGNSGIKQISKPKNVMEKIDDLKLSILNNIGNLYRISTLYLTITSLLIFTIQTFLRKNKRSTLYFINLFLLPSILARIAILSIISATSFNGASINYLSPLHPMLLIFILFNLFSLIRLNSGD